MALPTTPPPAQIPVCGCKEKPKLTDKFTDLVKFLKTNIARLLIKYGKSLTPEELNQIAQGIEAIAEQIRRQMQRNINEVERIQREWDTGAWMAEVARVHPEFEDCDDEEGFDQQVQVNKAEVMQAMQKDDLKAALTKLTETHLVSSINFPRKPKDRERELKEKPIFAMKEVLQQAIQESPDLFEKIAKAFSSETEANGHKLNEYHLFITCNEYRISIAVTYLGQDDHEQGVKKVEIRIDLSRG